VLIGSPNFGIATQLYPMELVNGGAESHGSRYSFPPIAPMLGNNGGEVLPLSYSVWSLNTWNVRGDDLRGMDTVAIAGNGDSVQATDGLVSVNSASVGFAFPDGDQRTRVIPYCHGSVMLGPCAGDFLTNIADTSHPTYQILRSFLDGGDAWKSIGVSASEASNTGGVVAELAGGLIGCVSGSEGRGNPCGHWPTLGTGTTDSPGVTDSFTEQKLPVGLPLLPSNGSGSNPYYKDFLPAGPASVSYNPVVWDNDLPYANQGWVTPRVPVDVGIQPGTFTFVRHIAGYYIHTRATQIYSRGIQPAGSSPGITPGSWISIYGENLAAGAQAAPNPVLQLGGTAVHILEYANGAVSSTIPCTIGYVSESQVNVKLPAGLRPGWHVLELTTAQQDAGGDRVPLMVNAGNSQ
jgi:hypothetical protein